MILKRRNLIKRGLRAGFRLTLSALALTLAGCGILSSRPAPTLVPAEDAASAPLPPGWRASEENDHLFQRTGNGGDPLFLSVLKDCGSPATQPLSASYRQLLVGFSDIAIVSQEKRKSRGTDVLESLAKAKLDGEPLVIGTLSFRDGDCAVDTALWTKADDHEKATTVVKNELSGIEGWLFAGQRRETGE